MKSKILMMLTILALQGCSNHSVYQLGASSEYVNHVQILDPSAPERNDGITTPLEGNYGKKVMAIYQKSPYEVKSARDIKHIRTRR